MDSSKVLTGCGIGCAVLVALILLVSGIGYFFVRDTVSQFEKMGESIDQLEKDMGEVTDYVPGSDGKIPSDRIEAFLEIRSQMQEMRRDMEDGLLSFSDDINELEEEGASFFRVIRLIGKGISGIPFLVEFYAERSRIQLEQGMSQGEYYYLYVIIYPCWLQKSLEDGPEFRLAGDSRDGDLRKDEDVYRERKERYLRQIRRTFKAFLKNQLDAARSLPETPENTEWIQDLNRELVALQDSYDRLPWQDGLPEVISSSLEPFRSELIDSYSRLVNPIELGLDDD